MAVTLNGTTSTVNALVVDTNAASSLLLKTNGTTGITVDGSNQAVTTSGAFTSTGAATLSSTLGVTGAATFSNTVAITGVTTHSNQTTLATGTSSIAPIRFAAGTNLTSATSGVMEYDGTVFYATIASNTRGAIRSEQVVALNTAYTLTSQTAAQKLFNNTTNGTVTLPVGTYQFECFYSLTSMSGTSGSFGFALGGTATFTQYWRSEGVKAALATATAPLITFNNGANTTLVTANTTTTGQVLIKGIINVSAAGTIIPQVSLGVAAAAVVGVGSYFRISPLSASNSTTNVTIGNWS
jgi:hypothetical protein